MYVENLPYAYSAIGIMGVLSDSERLTQLSKTPSIIDDQPLAPGRAAPSTHSVAFVGRAGLNANSMVYIPKMSLFR